MTLLRIALIAVFALTGVSSAGAQQSNLQRLPRLRDSVAQVQGRVIITLKSDRATASVRLPGGLPVPAEEQATIAARLDREIGVRARGAAVTSGTVFATVTDSQLAALVQDRNVDLVEADVLVPLSESHSMASIGAVWHTRSESTPWGIGRVGAPQTWSAGNTGAGAKIGIIDSGIEYNHPDLNVGGGYDFTTGSASSSAWTDNIGVCNGHGTHVAGVTAAKQNGQLVVGVAPGAAVYALKVFEVVSGGCSSWSSNQIAAINWAVTNGLDVVNLSLASSSGLTSYQNAVDAATAAGLVIVAASGNNGASTITFPARYNNVIAVAALDANDQRAWFSNAGPEVWLAAPGVGIVSTMPGASTGSKSGTSMAAPHVAGVVALMRSANPGWSVAKIRDELRLGALDVDAVGLDPQTGYGLVRAPASSVPAPVSLSVSPGARSVTITAGASAPNETATVTVSGGSASWVATRRKSWTTLTTASGTGSGTVRWSRATSALAVGTYVDTIAITATGTIGSPAVVYDTIKVVAGSVPLALQISPASSSTSAAQGAAAASGAGTVTVSGTGAATAAWTASKRKAWTVMTTAAGTGAGPVSWQRNTTGLAVGTYVDTITVALAGATGSPARIIDTLRILAATGGLSLQVTPVSSNVSATQYTAAPGGTGTVTVAGTGASTAAWTASKRKAWTVMSTAAGTGSGPVSWQRNTTGLAVGTYVDTISVTLAGATGSPARIIDTLRITASTPAPQPLTVSASPWTRSRTIDAAATASADSVTITIEGDGASVASWSVENRSSWNRMTVATGTGSGVVRWLSDAGALPAGTYVDTLRVYVNGLPPLLVLDSTTVREADPKTRVKASPRVAARRRPAASARRR